MKKIQFIITGLFCILALVSCDNDKNEHEDIINSTTKSVLLKEISITGDEKVSFNYDDDGELISISDNYLQGERIAKFLWNPLSIICNGQRLVTTTSPSGYLTSVYDVLRPTELTTYEYDNEGHLTRMIEKDLDDYAETDFIWQNGLLVYIEEKWQEYGEYTGSGIYTTEINYSKDVNKSGIWPASFWDTETIWFEPNDIDLPYILQTGLLGTAPTYLPSSIIKREESWSEEKYEISHSVNSNGLLSSETIKWDYGNSYTGVTNITYKYR